MSAPETPNPDDPFQWVIDTYYKKKSQGTVKVAYLSLFGSIGDSNSGGYENGAKVALKPWLEERNIDPTELTVDNAFDYLEDLQSAYSPGTQNTRAGTCRKTYEILNSRNVKGFDYNPFRDVLEDHPEVLDSKSEQGSSNTTIYEKSQLLDVIHEQHPVNQTVSMTLLKTARRIGGVLNLDFYDVHLDHPAADWPVHQSIRDKPDHIHFGPGVSQGERHRGEVRHDGQKTITTTPVPMDDELKHFLIWYLQIRRDSTHEGPFFINPRGVEHGDRLKSPAYRDWLTPIAKEKGYWFGVRDPDNIRPHYFRHWTTTKMRDRVGSDLTDYIRGDKKSVSDTYNHYTEEKARRWRENIPKFHEPYRD